MGLVAWCRRTASAIGAALVLLVLASCGEKGGAKSYVAEYRTSDYWAAIRQPGGGTSLNLFSDGKFHMRRSTRTEAPGGFVRRVRVARGTWDPVRGGVGLRFRVVYAEIDAGRSEDLFGKGERMDVTVLARAAGDALRFGFPLMGQEEFVLVRVAH